MIIFNNIEIFSFKSIFHCKLNFSDLQSGLYLLEGKNNVVNFSSSNGSGKSTLCSSIMYALYGTIEDNISVKKADLQNQNTVVKLKVILDFNIDDDNYVITRTDKSLTLIKNDEDISELTKTDTENKLKNIINLTKLEFINFTYLAQTSSKSNFLAKTPSEKMSCIKDFIFGEELLDLENKLNDYQRNIMSEYDRLYGDMLSIQSSIDTTKNIIEKQKEKIKTSNDDIELEDINLTDVINNKNVAQDKLNFLQEQVDKKRKVLSTIEKEISKNNTDKDYVIKDVKKLKENYKAVKNFVCPTCKQKLINNKEIIQDIKSKLQNDEVKYKDITKNLNFLQEKLTEQKAVVEDLKNEIKNNKENLEKWCSLENKINNNKKVEQIFDDSEMIKSIEENKDKLKSIESNLDKLKFKTDQIKKLQKYFKSDFINHIQQAFIMEIQNYLNLYCHDIFEEDFKLEFNKNSLSLLVGDKPYNYFSGGERQRLDFIFIFAIKVALYNFTNKCTNLLICDETLSGQDSQAFQSCIELINSLSKSENLITILVSHRDMDYQTNNKIIIERNEKSTKLDIIQN